MQCTPHQLRSIHDVLLVLPEARHGYVWPGSLTAKVLSVVRVSVPRILGVFGISAQRSASAGKRLSSCDHRRRRCPFLNPVHHGPEHIELVESRSASAVSHPRHKIYPAPLRHLLCSPVRCGKGLIVTERVQRREPWIAVAVEEKELAASC